MHICKFATSKFDSSAVTQKATNVNRKYMKIVNYCKNEGKG